MHNVLLSFVLLLYFISQLLRVIHLPIYLRVGSMLTEQVYDYFSASEVIQKIVGRIKH